MNKKIIRIVMVCCSVFILGNCAQSVDNSNASPPQPYSWTVTFNSSDADVEAAPASLAVVSPATRIAALPVPPEKEGLVFGGWWTGPGGTGKEFTHSTVVTGNMTVYARWVSAGLLKTITVGSHVLYPCAETVETELHLEVGYHTSSASVTAQAFLNDDEVWIPGTQPVALKPGATTTVGVSVFYGDSEDERIYTINIFRRKLEFTSLLVNENFEGAFPPAGWTVINNGGNAVWVSSATSGYGNYTGGAGRFADANSDFAGMGTTMNTEMRVQVLDFSGISNPALSYQTYFRQLGSSRGYVDISTDGGATWINLRTYSVSMSVGIGEYQVIPLDAYAGCSSVIIRFHYTTPSWSWFWQVDEVKIGQAEMS